MKQILQDLQSGETKLVDAPAPGAKAQHVISETSVSLISTGTERMLVDFGSANLFQKAKQQPDKVRMVLEKVQTDGLLTTVDAVRSKLAQPIPLGYCNVGVVSSVGRGVNEVNIGDRIVSNGHHADLVRVPKNLCAKIPAGVTDIEASFTVVAAIGLQGIRLANPTLGEFVVVTGVGLIGLLTVQMLVAQGCKVLAIDYDQSKLELAKSFGAEICNPGTGQDPVQFGAAFSQGKGVDAVIITASTKSNDPVSQAARMCRQRGRIVLVGVTGLELSRADFYEKELSFQVSCSYGPGRYDSSYEEGGQDYPYGLVRWTQQRNFEAVLGLMADGKLDLMPLVSHRFQFENATKAYEVLSDDKSALGILLEYDGGENSSRYDNTIRLSSGRDPKPARAVEGSVSLGFIGAGNYASRVLIPAFSKSNARLHTIASSGGISGVIHGEKNGFENATTDTEALLKNPDIDAVVITTRHNSHSAFACQALSENKHVFVEKPLALTSAEIENVQQAYEQSNSTLMLGFNRRFSPHIQKMKALLDTVVAPKSFVMVMNAGAIPADHWTQDPHVGGGRIIGEACHFIDLMRFFVGRPITSIQARSMGQNDAEAVTHDKAAILLGFKDGSFGTIHYLANGGASFPKERVEVFTAGRTLQLDNFRTLRGFNWPGFRKLSTMRQDKGQTHCVEAFINNIKNGEPAPIPADEIFEVAEASVQVARMLDEQSDLSHKDL